MLEKIKSFFSRIKTFAIPGLITFAVVVIALICKGIWPFGSNRIDYFDNMQQVAPLYAHLWDFLHGNASIWFDWYTGLGTNVSMSISAFSMLSPFNLLLYIIPRDFILESISILTIVKMVFMSVAMYVFLNRKFKDMQYCLKALFAVMYSLCGYVIMYGSCFTPWMDIVAIFPVIMIAYDRMMETGKKLFYIIMIAVSFIINYYLSAMIVLYIFIISGAYILIMSERKQWKEHAFNLGIGTVTGIGLSAFVLVPVLMQLSGSQRGSQDGGLISRYLGWISGSVINDGAMAALQRWMMLFGLAFVIAIICTGLKKYFKEDRKTTAYMGVLTAIVLLAVVVEGTNLIWHFGSYNGYTLRNGFLVAFTLIYVASFYATKMFKEIQITDKKKLIKQAAVATFICVVFIVVYNLMPSINEIVAGIFFLAVFITLFIVYIRKINDEKESFNCKSVIALVAVELFIGAYAFIGPPKFYSYQPYQVGDYVQLANKVSEDLQIEQSPTDRIINPDISLNANYPLILRRGALSSFTAALESDTQDYSKQFGYSKYFLWLLDSGGTVFTNSLLHVTQAVNQNDLDPVMYTKVKEAGDFSLYDANYKLPFAMCVDSTFLSDKHGNDWVSLHNTYYRALSGDEEDLVSGMPYASKRVDSTMQYTVHPRGNMALYMNITDTTNGDNDANCSELISSMRIYVNDEPVLIPTLGDIKNTAYFTDYNNNLVYLGCFNDETVNIRIEYDDPTQMKKAEVSIGSLDMDKMTQLCESYSDYKCDVSYTNDSLTLKINGTATKNYALIPVVFSDNWKVTLDGTEIKADKVDGLFTGVKVHSGENVIEFKFEAKGSHEGALISLAFLLLTFVFVVINAFKKIRVPAWIKYCAIFIYLQLFNLVVLMMFLIPAIAAVPAFIYRLILKL